MIATIKLDEREFELAVPIGEQMSSGRPFLAHCILCGYLWEPDKSREPKACARCKNRAYGKFPVEFDIDKCSCSFCRVEWDIQFAYTGKEPERMTPKEPWQPHKTPIDLLAKIVKKAG